MQNEKGNEKEFAQNDVQAPIALSDDDLDLIGGAGGGQSGTGSPIIP